MVKSNIGPARKLHRIMAGLTDVTAGNVSGIFVVTAAAHGVELVMIDQVRGHDPVNSGTGTVTGLALVGDHERNVSSRQAVTAGTVTGAEYVVVINVGIGPHRELRRCVAIQADIAAGNMRGGFGMTAGAVGTELVVIHKTR